MPKVKEMEMKESISWHEKYGDLLSFYPPLVMIIGNNIKGTYVVTFGMWMRALGNMISLVEQFSWELWWFKE